jgi:hypothetical protein
VKFDSSCEGGNANPTGCVATTLNFDPAHFLILRRVIVPRLYVVALHIGENSVASHSSESPSESELQQHVQTFPRQNLWHNHRDESSARRKD